MREGGRGGAEATEFGNGSSSTRMLSRIREKMVKYNLGFLINTKSLQLCMKINGCSLVEMDG